MARVLHSVGTKGVLERVSVFSVTPCSPLCGVCGRTAVFIVKNRQLPVFLALS